MINCENENVIESRISHDLVDYTYATNVMIARVDAIACRTAPELVWLLSHPPLYTAGTSAREVDLLEPKRFPVYTCGRGGQYTYHGPGQRIGYVILDLRKRGGDVRGYVADLERWLIATLDVWGIKGVTRDGRTGVWVTHRKNGLDREDKIAAIGVRVSRSVSFHGISLNVNPDLSHYDGIVPCGIADHGITSLADLGVSVPVDEVDSALLDTFANVFHRRVKSAYEVE